MHESVRDPDNTRKLAHLDKLAKETRGSIRYFKADLLSKGAYDEAMQGCELVYHTASPFIMEVKDTQKDLIDPSCIGDGKCPFIGEQRT